MLAATGVASANTIAAGSSPLYYSGVTDWSQTFAFGQFNPSLGTLVSVTITSQADFDTSGTLKNTSGSAQNFSFYETFLDTLTAPDSLGTVVNASLTTPLVSYTGVANGASVTYDPSGQPFLSSTTSTTLTASPADSLSAFIGSGTVNFKAATMTAEDINGGGGNIVASLNSTGSDTITVTYNYTPSQSTPEPFSMSLAGTGLVLVGLFGRKRFAR